MAASSLFSSADPYWHSSPYEASGEMDPYPFSSSPTSFPYTPDAMVAHSTRSLQDHLYASFLEGSTADVSLHVSGSWSAVYRLHRVILIQAVGSLLSSHECYRTELGHRRDRNFSDASLPQASLNRVSPRDHRTVAVLSRFTYTFQTQISQDQVPMISLHIERTDSDLLFLSISAFESVQNFRYSSSNYSWIKDLYISPLWRRTTATRPLDPNSYPIEPTYPFLSWLHGTRSYTDRAPPCDSPFPVIFTRNSCLSVYPFNCRAITEVHPHNRWPLHCDPLPQFRYWKRHRPRRG